MNELIREYLNNIYSKKSLTRQVLAERKELQSFLITSMEKYQREGYTEETAFAQAVADIPNDITPVSANESDSIIPNYKMHDDYKSDSFDVLIKSIVNVFYKVRKYIPYIAWTVFLIIYLTLASQQNEWLKESPFIVYPSCLALLYFIVPKIPKVTKRLKNLLIPMVITVSLMIIWYTIFIILGYFMPSLALWGGFAVIYVAAVTVMEKITWNKVSIIAKLLLASLIGVEIFLLANLLLTGWKLLWLILLATALIDIIIYFSQEKIKR